MDEVKEQAAAPEAPASVPAGGDAAGEAPAEGAAAVRKAKVRGPRVGDRKSVV